MKHQNVPDIPVKGFLETSLVDWPGRVCAILFLPGCSMRCAYCHNRVLVDNPERLPDIPLHQIIHKLSHYKGWLDGIVISGGEPTVHIGLPGFVEMLKNEGFEVKIDSNGYQPDMLNCLFDQGLIDGVSMDIKAKLDLDSYSRIAGVPIDINTILHSIQLILDSGVWFEFRQTVIPGIHTHQDVLILAEQLRRLGATLHLQPFQSSPDVSPELRQTPNFNPETLAEWQRDVFTVCT